jgi:hypothetical protein
MQYRGDRWDRYPVAGERPARGHAAHQQTEGWNPRRRRHARQSRCGSPTHWPRSATRSVWTSNSPTATCVRWRSAYAICARTMYCSRPPPINRLDKYVRRPRDAVVMNYLISAENAEKIVRSGSRPHLRMPATWRRCRGRSTPQRLRRCGASSTRSTSATGERGRGRSRKTFPQQCSTGSRRRSSMTSSEASNGAWRPRWDHVDRPDVLELRSIAR